MGWNEEFIEKVLFGLSFDEDRERVWFISIWMVSVKAGGEQRVGVFKGYKEFGGRGQGRKFKR